MEIEIPTMSLLRNTIVSSHPEDQLQMIWIRRKENASVYTTNTWKESGARQRKNVENVSKTVVERSSPERPKSAGSVANNRHKRAEQTEPGPETASLCLAPTPNGYTWC
jgi:hypothetical protein